jgi:dTDP-4-dehydrorhamnose reductase
MPAEPRIVVLGGAGQLGRAIVCGGGAGVVALDRAAADVTDPEALAEALGRTRPDVVINAAAFTAVDRAEAESDACFAVNRDGAGQVAAACAAIGVPLVHLSTDYVFDGRKGAPYVETDPLDPVNAYGASKAAGEMLVAARHERHVILRTAWVFGPDRPNFVRTILRRALAGGPLRVVDDQHGSPTPAPALARVVVAIARRLVEGDARTGVLHAAGAPDATWHALADAVVSLALPRARRPLVSAIPTSLFPTPARRPRDTRLDCRALHAAYGLVQPDWREALPRIVAALGLQETAATGAAAAVPSLAAGA